MQSGNDAYECICASIHRGLAMNAGLVLTYVQNRPAYVTIGVAFQAVITELRGAVKKVELDPASKYRIFSSLRNCAWCLKVKGLP
jgi:hypothetical protein